MTTWGELARPRLSFAIAVQERSGELMWSPASGLAENASRMRRRRIGEQKYEKKGGCYEDS